MTESNTEAEALIAARLKRLHRKNNSDSWSQNMENLMKQWGEKAGGLRFMHSHSGSVWKLFSTRLSITSIIVTGIASTLSLVASSQDDEELKNNFLYSIGGIGLISTLIQSFKKFYNAEEKAADHSSVSKQFGTFYRYITLQLGMSREDRESADKLSNWALKEYERLQQEAPPILKQSVELFKVTFTNDLQAVPDIAEEEYIINIYNSQKPQNTELPPTDISGESV
tara:strand:- start:1199 stop:1876 length:678 start_codon:yes stop_codon:yes gene_type:complete